MPSEIKQLLQRIEEEQLAARRGLAGLASFARQDFLTARQKNIDAYQARLRELCGEKATGFVQTMIECANLQYEVEQAREQFREELRKEEQHGQR